MKKITYFLFLFSIAICFSFCKTQQYTPMDYPKGKITFGNGGGFAGAMTEYVLLDNGNLFSKSNTDTAFVSVKKLERNLTKQMFNNTKFLNLENTQMNNPGNMYYFLQIKNEGNDNRIVWGGGEAVPEEITKFYKVLNHLLNNGE